MSKLSKRITAMLLSGMLVIGSAPGSAFAASTDVDPGQTSEIAEEVYEEDTSEEPASGGETSEIEETSEAPAAAGENYSEETSAEEAAVQYYTVTLDANGGYFENEWDDSIGDFSQQVEVVEKHIPVDGTVAAVPVFTDQEGQSMLFVGWSLERDGELVAKAEEEYIPVDNCVLYAAWRAEDAALVETEEQEVADEGTEQADSVQKSEEYYAAEESADAVTSEENPVEEEVVTEFTEDTSDVPVGAGETTQVEETSEAPASTADLTEEASAEHEAQYYTVTLDANGGFFENEWDNSIGDYAQQAEVVEKHVPVDGTVAAFPIFTDPDGQTMVFAGWSLERDGEILPQEQEGYAPVGDCVLYAVWKIVQSSDVEDVEFELPTVDTPEKDSGSQNVESEYIVDQDTESVYEGADQMEESETENALKEQRDEEFIRQEEVSNEEFVQNVVTPDIEKILEDNEEKTGHSGEASKEETESIAILQDLDLKKDALEESVLSPSMADAENVFTPIIPDDAVEHNGNYYYIFDDTLTWKEAKSACEIRGGHLVTITSEEENDFIIDLIKSHDVQGKYHFWAGGTDEGHEGTWTWITGEEWQFSNWEPGQPNNDSGNISGRQDYLEIWNIPGYSNVLWNDEPNDGYSEYSPNAPDYLSLPYYSYICEWDNSGLWMTIFSNKNDILDGGHAFLNIENETDEDVYIGNYKLSAGDNVYIAGRGVRLDDSNVKLSSGGIFYNFEGVCDIYTSEQKGDNYYRDFSWYTVGIGKEDLKTLYSCIRKYGTYDLVNNNCTHFATSAWNAIVDGKYKVPSTGVPGILKNYIVETLKGKTATELRLDDKDITDILILDSNGDFMPYTLDNETYFNGVNSLRVIKSGSNTVTLGWDSPSIAYRNNKYNITTICVVYTDDKGKSDIISVPPDCTSITVKDLISGTHYSFKIFGISDHISSKAGIVTGKESLVKCEITTRKVDQLITVNTSVSSIAMGKTATVSITGAKGAVSYKSSNTAIATVNPTTGVVTGKKAGTVTITATSAATENYNAASKTITIKVVPASIAKATVTCPTSKVWAGWALTPVPTVKVGTVTLKKGTDFSLAFKNNKNVGTATITITGKGNYTGTIKKTFKINPKPTLISKLTGGSKKFTIGWKKQALQTSGYQIQYSSRKDFKTQKIVTVSGASKTSRTVSGLAKKHKYYVRIRTYKTVGKTKYYSTWSAAKTVTTK